jgi:hypothetical protein
MCSGAPDRDAASRPRQDINSTDKDAWKSGAGFRANAARWRLALPRWPCARPAGSSARSRSRPVGPLGGVDHAPAVSSCLWTSASPDPDTWTIVLDNLDQRSYPGTLTQLLLAAATGRGPAIIAATPTSPPRRA